jgi:catechol 2,3-dioxygenase-like lactoylglutathione lyase family enzyme
MVTDARERFVKGSAMRTRGIHHLVFNTDDMKATIDFYRSVLGVRLIHALKVPPGTSRGNPPFENLRHYFFDMGNDSTLAFFELPKGAKPQGDRDAVGAMQHCAFSVSDEAARAIMARLDAHGVAYTGPLVPMAGVLSIYFFDCNGIRLELCWRPIDREGDVHVVESCAQPRAEALRELRTLCDDPAWLDEVTEAFA